MSQRLMVRPTKFLHGTLLIGGLLFKPLKGGTSLACVSSVRTGFLQRSLCCAQCVAVLGTTFSSRAIQSHQLAQVEGGMKQ